MSPQPIKDPALEHYNTIPDFSAFDPSRVEPLLTRLIAKQDQALQELESSCTPTWAGVVQPLTDLAEPLSYAWGVVHHLLSVKDSEPLRDVVQKLQPLVVAASLRLAQSEALYRAHREIQNGAEWAKLDEAQRRVVEAAILGAEHSGIALAGAERARFNEIEAELARLGTHFSNHVLDATKAFSLILRTPEEVRGLPETVLGMMAQSARAHAEGDATLENATASSGPWRLTLDAPILGPFLKHAYARDLREKLYRAYVTQASSGELDNQPIILDILRLRKEKARLLGYATYADLSLSRKMAKQVPAVEKMLADLRRTSRPVAEAEYTQLIAFVAAQTGEAKPDVKLWDVGFWAERQREKLLDFTDEQLRPFFPLPRVLEGLFGVAERLFGVKIVAADGQAPIWEASVRFFRVLDATGQAVASFFLDPYTRPAEKRGGAWMNTCLDRKLLADGSVRLPVAYLICNQSPPVGQTPSLMTFGEVETLFHEFGHGLQHMLTRVNYVDAAGINNIEWDAVELPSQFMENWCYHRPTLLTFARHFESGEPLPQDLFDKLLSARNYRAGSQFLRQVHLGSLDLALHSSFEPNDTESLQTLVQSVARENTILKPLPEDRFLCSFGHIFAGGYAAGYYSYKWAEVLAADAFTAFTEAGLDNPEKLSEVGTRFRDTVLALGGGKEPGAVFRLFRGRDPDPKALLESYGLSPAAAE
ncbi:MAG: M3 family metallopeptidase [Polyangiaceae bacterium]|nr:M3 family metallopeptidase [Polyangiaceae bacterium]